MFHNFKKIGEGGFGDVFTAERNEKNADGHRMKVAIKVSRNRKGGTLDLESLINEILMLDSCHDPNIVNYLQSYMYKEQVWVVMEYLDGGSLTELITNFQMTEPHIAAVSKGVLSGLNYLHQQNRIHRDIKSDNVLLGSNGEVKVADLGLCAQLDEQADVKNTMAGSPYWMAPEVILCQPYATKVDVWGMGALAMEMAEGKAPYHHYKPLKALLMIATQGAPPLKNVKDWSEDFRDFFKQVFDNGPCKPMACGQAVET